MVLQNLLKTRFLDSGYKITYPYQFSGPEMGCVSQNEGLKTQNWRSAGLKSLVCSWKKKTALGSETHFWLKHPPKSVFWYIFWYSKVHMGTMGCQKKMAMEGPVLDGLKVDLTEN